MTATPGAPVGSRTPTGAYFTKYSEDHWTEAESTPLSAVMFKQKEYPSASVALEAYIQQHEGRPGLGASLLGAGRLQLVEPVEDLLTPLAGLAQHNSSRMGFVDHVQAQRLQALKRMVDEAYERLEAQTMLRAHSDGPQLNVSGYQQQQAALVNRTLTESQRVLATISPLPGVTPASSCIEGTISTDALLQAPPYHQSHTSAGATQQKRTFTTMQGYVEEARRAAADPPLRAATSAGAVSHLQASLSLIQPGHLQSSHHPSEAPHYDPHVSMGVVGSTANPTVLSVPPSSRGHYNGGGANGNISGGRSLPSWVHGLGSSQTGSVSPTGRGRQQKQTVGCSAGHISGQGGQLTVGDLGVTASSGSWNRSKDDLYLLQRVSGGRPDPHSHRPPHGNHEGQALSDHLSLTTDDLVYATPDGRSLSALKIKSAMSSPARHQVKEAPPSGGAQQSLPTQEDPTGAAGRLLSSMRRDFAERLLQEVEEDQSSIVTAHGLHPYESPILPRRPIHHEQPPQTPVVPISPTKLRTLGLLTPETERLLTHPPRPAPMPGYEPTLSPAMLPGPYHSDGWRDHGGRGVVTPPTATTTTSDPDLAPLDTHDLSIDFAERVRALLLVPPGGEVSNCSPGSDRERTADILDGDREWERQPSYKPPKYVSEDISYGPRIDASNDKRANIVDSFLKECLEETNKEVPLTLSGPDQPGSMEALKNMLFRVQSMVPPPGDQSVNETTESPSSGEEENQRDLLVELDAGAYHHGAQGKGAPTVASQQSLLAYQHLVANSDCFEEQDGTESLQRAMEHLGRLKTLVKDTTIKKSSDICNSEPPITKTTLDDVSQGSPGSYLGTTYPK